MAAQAQACRPTSPSRRPSCPPAARAAAPPRRAAGDRARLANRAASRSRARYLEPIAPKSRSRRAAALQRLAAQNPEAAESHLAIAEAALAAQLWGEARRHLGMAVAAAPPRAHAAALPVDGAARRQRNRRPAGGRATGSTAPRRAARPLLCLQPCGAASTEWQPVCRHAAASTRYAGGAPEHRPRRNWLRSTRQRRR